MRQKSIRRVSSYCLPGGPIGRSRALDGLRGIAVLLVVSSHASSIGWHIVPWIDMSGTGKLGVWLFFVLSAFLLTSQLDLLAQTGRLDRAGLARYAIARIFRIFPLYLCVLGWSVATERMPLSEAMLHATLQKGRGVYWAIPVEVKYYVVIPILVATYHCLCRRSLLGFAAILGICIGASVWIAPPSLTLVKSIELGPYLADFAIGSLVALAFNRPERPHVPSWLAVLVALALVATIPSVAHLLANAWSEGPIAPDAFHAYGPLFASAWAVLLVKGLDGGVWSRCLAWPPLGYVGRVSFSLYLIHIPTIQFLARMDWLPSSLRGVAALCIAIIVASATFALVEYPGIQAGRFIGRRILPGTASQGEASPAGAERARLGS